jgi:RNA polymerase sigma factor (sigma-70 family)
MAQEMTQDVFVDLFAAIQKGAQIESERAWLYTVASRTATDHWRRERPRMWVELESNTEAAEDVPSGERDAAAQVEQKERIRRVSDRLQKLPRERRLCLQLRMRGLRYREIGVLSASMRTHGVIRSGRSRKQPS